EPASDRTASGERGRSVACQPSGSPPPGRDRDCDRLDRAELDELAERGLGDADVAANPDETGTTVRAQPPGASRAAGLERTENLGSLGAGQQPINGRHGHHSSDGVGGQSVSLAWSWCSRARAAEARASSAAGAKVWPVPS